MCLTGVHQTTCHEKKPGAEGPYLRNYLSDGEYWTRHYRRTLGGVRSEALTAILGALGRAAGFNSKNAPARRLAGTLAPLGPL